MCQSVSECAGVIIECAGVCMSVPECVGVCWSV